MMTDWGGHKFGGTMHGLKVDHTGPTHIYYPDGKEHKYLTFVFPGGKKLYVGGGTKYICEQGEAKFRKSGRHEKTANSGKESFFSIADKRFQLIRIFINQRTVKFRYSF